MFIIFGWNHQKTTNYGAVKKCQCQNCHNTKFWHLDKTSNFFTFFFIPIFPHTSYYWFYCPICNHGIKLDKSEFENYKLIAELKLKKDM